MSLFFHELERKNNWPLVTVSWANTLFEFHKFKNVVGNGHIKLVRHVTGQTVNQNRKGRSYFFFYENFV